MNESTETTSKQDDKLWLDMSSAVWPDLSNNVRLEMRRQAAVLWMFEDKNEITKLYDQYVMLKTIKQ